MFTRSRNRFLMAALLVGVVALVGACSSDSNSSSSSSSSSSNGRTFSIDTPDGSVTVSLDGKLPTTWPASFPTPSGAKVGGSGAIANETSGTQIAVYTYSGQPSDAYNFYKTNPALTVSDTKAIGGTSNYVGTMTLSGSYTGSVSVVALLGNTYIVVVLTNSSTSSSSSSSSASSSSSSASSSSSDSSSGASASE